MAHVLVAQYREAIEEYKIRLCDGIGVDHPEEDTTLSNLTPKGNCS